eukprot:m.174820 g.174820  ORF g.174820 m.174820 type:complete len:116 (-) comp15325_c4_seq12:830-1177(-)
MTTTACCMHAHRSAVLAGCAAFTLTAFSGVRLFPDHLSLSLSVFELFLYRLVLCRHTHTHTHTLSSVRGKRDARGRLGVCFTRGPGGPLWVVEASVEKLKNIDTIADLDGVQIDG